MPDWLVDAVSGAARATNGLSSPAAADKPRGLAAVPDVIRGKRADTPGERHELLVRYASSLRARDVPIGEAEELFRVVWRRCEQPPACETPMPWGEARDVLADVYGRYQANYSRPDPAPDGLDPDDPDDGPRWTAQLVRGGNFILDTDPNPEPLWGRADEVLHADGEALVIAGPQGVGKTTIAQQLSLGRAGFPEYADLLGWPVTPGRRLLYLAMDRPKQVARSFRRMVGEAWRAELNDRVVVWQGPPPHDLAKYPDLLTRMAEEADADTVTVDSLKDAAIGLSDDEVGAGWNRARQNALTAGVQLIECHHNRKALNGAKAHTPTIDDLYGSTWLSSGAGSVLLLSGAPGDPIVRMHHLKQPAEPVGPLRLIHDAATGRTSVWHAVDLLAAVNAARGGLTALDAARLLYESDTPTPADKEKARRKLDQLTRQGTVRMLEQGERGTQRWGSL